LGFVPQPNLRDRRSHYLTNLVENQNKEVYIVSGGDDYSNTRLNNKVSVPDNIWKAVLVLDKPDLGIFDVDENTLAFGLYLPNTPNYTENGDRDRIRNSTYPWRDKFNFNDKEVGLFNIGDLEAKIGYDLFSNISDHIQDAIENQSITDIGSKLNLIDNLSSPLLAITDEELYSHNTTTPISPLGSFNNSSIGHSGIQNQIVKTTTYRAISDVSPLKIGVIENSLLKNNINHVSSTEISQGSVHIAHDASSKIGVVKRASEQVGSTEVGISNDGIGDMALMHKNSSQIGTSKINSNHTNLLEISSSQVDISQDNSFEVDARVMSGRTERVDKLNSSEVALPVVVPNQQFFRSDFPSHNSKPEIINVLNNSATKIWSDLLQSETQLDIDFQITDLPKGQLAEGSITGFDDSGKPNAGTILIDSDANGVGWFVDETPLESSEFGIQNSENYLLAAAESEATGKYDLLTTVLHELSHLYGFIDGYQGFDVLKSEVRSQKSKVFISNELTVTLDGEHLDKLAHPYDLLNTHLAPGMRKLPSELDVEILQAILADNDGETRRLGDGENLEAALTSDPLLAINNGDFSISDTTTNGFGWNTRGDSNIENAQAVLTEDSPFLSNFSQTFTVPEAAKTIQFKLVETELGASDFAPPDAFEVALLDAKTNESLVTDHDLTETDSLLNIQPDGTAHFSDQVRIGGATSGEIINLDKSRIVTIDISDLTPGTEATLYFDLIGLWRCG
jgi:large repetitive protein